MSPLKKWAHFQISSSSGNITASSWFWLIPFFEGWKCPLVPFFITDELILGMTKCINTLWRIYCGRDAHAPCGIRTVFYFRRSNMQEFCGKIRGNSRNFVIFRVKTFGILWLICIKGEWWVYSLISTKKQTFGINLKIVRFWPKVCNYVWM